MVTITLSILYAAACFKWGEWRRWQEFYPTILYVIIGDLAYNFVFHDHTLWLYHGAFAHTISDMIVALFMFPSIVILFLTHWPQKRVFQIFYVLVWAGFNLLLEFLSVLLDVFEYDNGWTVWWSLILLIVSFIMIRIHYKKPLLAWPISLALGVATALIFGLPSGALK